MGNKEALLIIDVQNDFCPEGALPVPEGDRIVPLINQLMQGFDIIIATQDWHPPGHKSFASAHPGKEPFETVDLQGTVQVLWSDHCVQGSRGAQLLSGLDTKPIRMILRKGMNPEVDSYSGFRDNSKTTITGLDGCLKALGIEHIYLVGLATDFCVYFTAMDGLENGYKVTIILDATRGINVPEGSMEEKLTRFRNSGGIVANSDWFVHP
ncbi:MAG: bifunctional nicotinamidase/pyrazinamidase [bacterium]|nr:bifunctional nicotinamidase/pyrazinamidase [bacterium]